MESHILLTRQKIYPKATTPTWAIVSIRITPGGWDCGKMPAVKIFIFAKTVSPDNLLIVKADNFIDKTERRLLRNKRKHLLFQSGISLHKVLR